MRDFNFSAASPVADSVTDLQQSDENKYDSILYCTAAEEFGITII